MEYTGGIAVRRKYLQKGNKISKLKLTKDNSVLVFPFNLTMGYITSTENGIRQEDSARVFDYSTFQRIFTGLENVIAQWEGAYKVTKENTNDTFLTKEYKVGNSFKAYVPKENLGAQFEASAISGDFLAEFTQETFTIHTYEDIQEADLFKLFIIPTLKENKWLYITSADKYFLPNGKLHHVEITLESLNNRIAKSGKAIEEFVQRGAPGEGYAFPVVDEEQNVTLNDINIKDVPITSLQIEGAGAFAMGTMYAHGRPTIQKKENGVTQGTFNPKIEAPRILLPLRIETAIPSPVNTRPSAETDWLVGKFKPTLNEDFADWKNELQAGYDLTQRAQFEGVLKSIDNDDIVNKSNPVNEGTRNNLLWDKDFTFPVDKIYNTATDIYTDDTLTLKKEITLPELLAHNIFGLSAITTLPLSVEQNIAWSLKDIPLIGGFAPTLTFGIPIGWTNTAIKVKMDDILLAIPASLRDYANVLIKQSDKLRIDLNTFTDEATSNDAIEFSGIKATGSIWKTQLTDRFTKTIGGTTYTFNTVDLAQPHPKKDVNNIDIPNPNGVLQWDETCKPAPRGIDTPGYVIDTSTYKAIAKMDVRTTFFSNNTQVWAGTHQTTAKFTGSIRDWTNAIKYSNWKEETGKDISYPGAITSPNPPNTQNPLFNVLTSKQYTTNYDFNNLAGSELLTLANRNGNNFEAISFNFEDANTKNKKQYIVKFEEEIDVSPYGGSLTFANNYDNLEIDFSNELLETEFDFSTGNQTQKIFINIRDILTTGKITHTLETISDLYILDLGKTTSFIVNNSNEKLTNEVIRVLYDLEYKIELFFDNDILKITYSHIYTWKEVQNNVGVALSKYTPGTTLLTNIVRADQTARMQLIPAFVNGTYARNILEIKQILAIPKTI